MKSTGRLPFSWWNIQADPHFGGSMLMQGLMNSRGRPTILKGSTRETISLDHAVAVFYILRIFHSQSKRKCRKYINFCKCLLYTFVVKCKRYVFVALVFTLTLPTKFFMWHFFMNVLFIILQFTTCAWTTKRQVEQRATATAHTLCLPG